MQTRHQFIQIIWAILSGGKTERCVYGWMFSCATRLLDQSCLNVTFWPWFCFTLVNKLFVQTLLTYILIVILFKLDFCFTIIIYNKQDHPLSPLPKQIYHLISFSLPFISFIILSSLTHLLINHPKSLISDDITQYSSLTAAWGLSTLLAVAVVVKRMLMNVSTHLFPLFSFLPFMFSQCFLLPPNWASVSPPSAAVSAFSQWIIEVPNCTVLHD